MCWGGYNVVYHGVLMVIDIMEAPGSALPATHSLEVAEPLRHPCGRWQVHSLSIILHLEPDGSSESPSNVEESFDDQSPFFLWDGHRSVSSKNSSFPKDFCPSSLTCSGTRCSAPPHTLILPREERAVCTCFSAQGQGPAEGRMRCSFRC